MVGGRNHAWKWKANVISLMESTGRPASKGPGTVDITRGFRKPVVQQTRKGMRMEVEGHD